MRWSLCSTQTCMRAGRGVDREIYSWSPRPKNRGLICVSDFTAPSSSDAASCHRCWSDSSECHAMPRSNSVWESTFSSRPSEVRQDVRAVEVVWRVASAAAFACRISCCLSCGAPSRAYRSLRAVPRLFNLASWSGWPWSVGMASRARSARLKAFSGSSGAPKHMYLR